MISQILDSILRDVVLTALAAAGIVALTHWLVREGKLSPFGPWARGVRKASDPLLKPIEKRLARGGRNPQEASVWLLGFVVMGGVLLIPVSEWLVSFFNRLAAARGSGPRGWLRFAIDLGFNLLLFALLARVVVSWIGAGRTPRWTRMINRCTDWLVDPIRRRVPPIGLVDVSPLLAYIAILLVRSLVFSFL